MDTQTLKVRNDKHPRGEEGIRKSIEEIVAQVEAGRMDPKTLAWARETVAMAGYPSDRMEIASAILNRLRSERGFIEDPVDAEAVVSSACLLDGCHGLKFFGEDCDGLLIGFLSAVEAVGVEAALVNHAYDPKGQIVDHVLAAVYDRPPDNPRKPHNLAGRWIRCDPATKQPFGTVSKPTRERFFLIPGGKLLCDHVGGFCPDEKLARVGAVRENLRPSGGDFVGVGRPAVTPAYAAPFEDDAFDGQLGGATPSLEGVSEAFYRFMVDKLESAIEALQLSYDEMSTQRDEMEIVVTTLGEPLIQEPTEGQKVWTAELERDFKNLQYIVPLYITYLREAAAGTRQIVWDEDRQTILIVGVPGEVAIVEQGKGVGTVDTTGIDTTKPPEAVEQISMNPWVIGGAIVIGLGMIAVCTYFQHRIVNDIVRGVSEYAEAVKFEKAIEWGKKRVDAGEDPDKVNKDVEKLLADSHDRNVAKQKQADEPFKNLLDTAKVGLYAFLAVGTVAGLAYGASQIAAIGKRRY